MGTDAKQAISDLIKRKDNGTIDVWSVQPKKVFDELKDKGIYKTSLESVPHCRRPATQWMADEMKKRELIADGKAPLWTFLSKPKSRSELLWDGNFADDQFLLQFSIPKGRMLISFHWPWANIFLPRYPRFFLSWNQESRDSFRDNSCQLLAESVCQESWQKLFDLSLIHEPELSWWDRRSVGARPSEEDLLRLQATTGAFLKTELIEALSEW